MSDVQAELIKATKVKPKKNESDQDFRKRLMAAVDESLEDSAWAELSEEAQTWCNESAKALKKKGALPDFPDAAEDEDDEDDEDEDEKPAKKSSKKAGKKAAKKEEDDEDDEDEDEDGDSDDDGDSDEDEDEDAEDEDADEDEKPAKKSSKKDDKKADKKADKKSKDDKKSSKRGTGVTASIKQIMLVNPHIELDDLTAKLKDKGFDPISSMTVSTVRADFRHTLKIMHESGALSDSLAKKMDKGKK